MTTTGAPRPATCSTACSVSRTRVPCCSATSTARWMTGPSITGSVYGMPSSTTSAPASIMVRTACTEPGTVG